MSPKGGIGKTTTSDSIAYMLGEEQEKRVLVLDGDPQGDTSKTFGVYEPDGIGMSELLEKHECVGGTYKTGDLIRPTEYSHVDIIPANGYLMKTDMNLLLKSEDNQVTRLREALEEVSDAYDYCVCDCGRLLDMVVINILIAAELIIAPVKVGGYEIEALQNLEEQIEDLRDINPDLRMEAYDDDLILIATKGKKDIRIVAAGHGNRFEDIENQLIGEKGKGWRELIAGAIDNAYDRLVASTPPQTEEEKTHCEMIKEAVKGMFINESRTAAEAEFIKTHIVDYEKIFDVCMNGDDLEFKKGLVRLQKMQNEYVMQREREETANE